MTDATRSVIRRILTENAQPEIATTLARITQGVGCSPEEINRGQCAAAVEAEAGRIRRHEDVKGLLPRDWQGRQDLNLQPTVLETVALPIELLPCNSCAGWRRV